jgi:hypothetical protein
MPDIKVVHDGVAPEPFHGSGTVEAPEEAVAPEVAPTAPDNKPARITPRLALAAQRQEILSTLHLDLKVPRWSDPEIYVRYRPIEAGQVEKSMRRRAAGAEDQQNDASLLFHADVLISACLGVFAVLDGDLKKKYSLGLGDDGLPSDWPSDDPADWTRFDRDLAEALGLEEWKWGQATNIVRALYLTDGDLIDASTELSAWSTRKNETAAEDF